MSSIALAVAPYRSRRGASSWRVADPSVQVPPPPTLDPRARVAAAAGETRTSSASVDWEALDAQMQDQTTIEISAGASDIFGDDLAIAFSGAEDVTSSSSRAPHEQDPSARLPLDTGRLNPETYQLFDDVEKHFGIKIEFTFPDEKAVTDLVNEKGMFSFFEDGHKECCGSQGAAPAAEAQDPEGVGHGPAQGPVPGARAWRCRRCRWTPCSKASRAAPARSSSSTR